MINKIMNVTESDPMYDKIMADMNDATDDKLVIVARSYKNRKDDVIAPIAIKNGIYFYVGYELDDKIAFPGKVTPSQIYQAKLNMIRKARLGGMLDVLINGGFPLDEFEFGNDPMNIVTLDSHMYGAGLLCCEEFIKTIYSKIGNAYILPSSVHEIIIVPLTNEMDKDYLTQMIRNINATEVSENEYLADRAFEISEWM